MNRKYTNPILKALTREIKRLHRKLIRRDDEIRGWAKRQGELRAAFQAGAPKEYEKFCKRIAEAKEGAA